MSISSCPCLSYILMSVSLLYHHPPGQPSGGARDPAACWLRDAREGRIYRAGWWLMAAESCGGSSTRPDRPTHPRLSESRHPRLSESRHPRLSESRHPRLSESRHPRLSESRTHAYPSQGTHPCPSQGTHACPSQGLFGRSTASTRDYWQCWQYSRLIPMKRQMQRARFELAKFSVLALKARVDLFGRAD